MRSILLVSAIFLGGCDTTSDRRQDVTPGQTPVTQNSSEADTSDADTQSQPDSNSTGDSVTSTPNTTTNDYSADRIASIDDSRVPEISGMAVSRQAPDRLWVINDSGQTPVLHAVATDGSYTAEINLDIENRDWEDLAGFTDNGEHFLMVAETGDNLEVHADYALHVFIEPQIDNAVMPARLSPLTSINFVYEDGSHDSEAVAVSTTTKRIYIITKEEPASLYELPLDLSVPNQRLTATKVAELPDIPQSAGEIFLGGLAGVNLASVTAFDIDNAREMAWLLTYRGVFRVNRVPSESWPDAFGGLSSDALFKVHTHAVAQGEALAVDESSGEVYFTSEKLPAPLWLLVPRQ